ncbi:MAG: GAF domain-containing protein [Caldilineaceae bacterium]|nr:GAF domain-containing protein [Caldilineaceae bacterium]
MQEFTAVAEDVTAYIVPAYSPFSRANRRQNAYELLLEFSLSSRQYGQKSELFHAAGMTAMKMTGAEIGYLYYRQRAATTSERLGESVYYRLDQVFKDDGDNHSADLSGPLPQPLIEHLAIRQEITRQADNCHLVVPIHRDGKPMALLDLHHRDHSHFCQTDMEMMDYLARQLDAALQSEYVVTTRTAQIELAQYLSAELDLAALLGKVAQSAAKIANAQASSILLIQPQSDTMRFASVHGLSDSDREMLRQLVVPLHGSMAGSVAVTGQPLLSNDAAIDPRFYSGVSNSVEMKTRSLLAVPMRAGDKAIGALEVINQRYDDGFTEADVELLTLFASQAAIAIQNARLLAERQASLSELTKLEQRKSQFIALASHELRTPLNLISGYATLLRSSLPDCNVNPEHEVMDFLSQIDQATNRLTGMVNNITSLYNLETGRTQLLLERKNVLENIHSVIDEYAEWSRQKGISFCLNIPDHPLYATCDPIEVNRILGNLINNAIKFTPEGGQITISAEHAPVDNNNGYPATERLCGVMISVADTGPGIDLAQLESVFERFSQIGSHLNRVQGGIGLGLPLAKGLVEKHGGQLWAEANVGTGATFHFTLPAAKNAAPCEEEPSPALVV